MLFNWYRAINNWPSTFRFHYEDIITVPSTSFNIQYLSTWNPLFSTRLIRIRHECYILRGLCILPILSVVTLNRVGSPGDTFGYSAPKQNGMVLGSNVNLMGYSYPPLELVLTPDSPVIEMDNAYVYPQPPNNGYDLSARVEFNALQAGDFIFSNLTLDCVRAE